MQKEYEMMEKTRTCVHGQSRRDRGAAAHVIQDADQCFLEVLVQAVEMF